MTYFLDPLLPVGKLTMHGNCALLCFLSNIIIIIMTNIAITVMIIPPAIDPDIMGAIFVLAVTVLAMTVLAMTVLAAATVLTMVVLLIVMALLEVMPILIYNPVVADTSMAKKVPSASKSICYYTH